MALPPSEQGTRHPLPRWVRWLIVSLVFLVVVGGTVLWIIQPQAIIPIAILTALGTIFAFFQILPSLFPDSKHPTSTTPPHHSLPTMPDNQPAPLQTVPARQEESEKKTHTLVPISSSVDWGEAPHPEQFYGRERELSELTRWIMQDRCRVVAVLGMGGIGKTSLVATLTDRVQNAFEYVLWRSLQNAPPLKDILQDGIQFFSNQQRTSIPEDPDGQISLLIEHLRMHRCLLILDNMESILQGGQRSGQYQPGYEAYGKLIRRIGETRHQSILLLTSREKSGEIALLEGDTSSVRSYQLEGLPLHDGRAILREKGLKGIQQNWETLIDHYAGNPLALKLVSQFIREVFDGNIADFLASGEKFFSDIRDVLDQQFERLSTLEQEIMYWLAIEREPVSLNDIQNDIVHPVSHRELQEALRSLLRRHLIEKREPGFLLQNVIMEYVTARFVEQASSEINTGSLALLESHALMKAQTREYVRESQVRLLLTPVIQSLLARLKPADLESQCRNILATLQKQNHRQPGYAAGNLLNLLIHLGCALCGHDFSHLQIRQARLENITLTDTSFAYADLATSIFTDTFGGIISVAFSPNDDLLAAGTNNGEVWIWNFPDGTLKFRSRAHMGFIRSIAFSPDGQILASGGDDQKIQLWEVKTKRCVATLRGHTDAVWSLAFSPDGQLLASSAENQDIRIWEVSTGYCFNTLRGPKSMVLAFSPDGAILAGGGMEGIIHFWEVSTGHRLMKLQDHSSRIWSIAFNVTGSVLASSGDDQTIRLWEVRTGHRLAILHGHTDTVRSVAFNTAGTILASGSEDHTVKLWEVSTGHCLKTLQGHSRLIYSVAFSPDGQIVASGGDDRTIRLWEVNTGHCLTSLQGYANWTNSIAFDPDGTVLASGSDDHIIHLWDVTTGTHLTTLRGHTDRISSIAFSPDGQLLVSSGQDQVTCLWNVKTRSCLKTIKSYHGWVNSVTFSPDGQIIASGGRDQMIHLWDSRSGKSLNILQGHTQTVNSITFRPDGQLLVSGSSDHTIRLWDAKTGDHLKTLRGHVNRVRTVTFSPDGQLLASGSSDHTIRLWDISTGQCLYDLQQHTNSVKSIAFSPDGQLFASGSNDHTVRLWNTSTGQCLNVLRKEFTGQIRSVAFSPDGSILAAGSTNSTINFWNIQTGKCLRTLINDRPYERMNITGVTGLTEAQKAALKSLGAIED